MDYSGKIIKKTPVTPSQTSASGVWTLDDATQAQRTNTWPVANVPNPISRSLRFRSSASASLTKTFSTDGTSNTVQTISAWVKRGQLGSNQVIMGGYDAVEANQSRLQFTSSDTINLRLGGSSANDNITTAVFRDPSAWYHIVASIDTTQATLANRAKIYVNGVQQTVASPSCTQNQITQFANGSTGNTIGEVGSFGSTWFDGYMTEINFIDGQALTPSSFGGTNAVTGVWEPRAYTGTYGTNGFYLNFKDNTSTTTLGYDYSGNSNNWTTNNISLTAGSTYDSMLDVPTQWIGYGNAYETTRGNYATFNPILYMGTGSTKSNGNLTFAGGGTGGPPYNYSIYSTFTQNTGKWYWEVTITTAGSQPFVGMFNTAISFTGTSLQGSAGPVLYGYDGNYYNETSGVAFGSTYTTGDVIGVAVDYDNNLIWFSKNGTWQNSGVPSTGTNGKTFGSGKTWGTGYVESGSSVSASTFNINFGQRPFSYAAPTGFLNLCTTNLPSPTILQGNQYMDAVLFDTQSGSYPKTITGSNFQPDLVWAKSRTQAYPHFLFDSVRGTGITGLNSNNTDAQGSDGTTNLSSFNSNGFTIAAGDAIGYTNGVSWFWKASNAAGVTNTAGSITSTVSANTTSGFSIVTYTGTGSAATVGHGLGVAPKMIIVKSRSAVNDWPVYHASLGASYLMKLNTTDSVYGPNSVYWNGTAPTSTVFSLGTSINNTSSATFVAYCFAEVAGFSKFGSYTGNGSADGVFVYTGFRPAFILVKKTDTSGTDWVVMDNKRLGYNVTDVALNPNASYAENSGYATDFTSNGFKLRTTTSFLNGSGATYIYACFAENPFKNALAR